MLAEKPQFKSKQDLFKIIDLDPLYENSNYGPFEYLSGVSYPEKYDMRKYVKQVDYICIFDLKKDLKINCLANEIRIDFENVQKIKEFKLGTQRFLNSIKIVTIEYYDDPYSLSDVRDDID